MTASRAAVDSVLVRAGDALFFGGPVQGRRVHGMRALSYGGRGGAVRADAQAVRETLGQFAKRAPEAVVKLASSAKSLASIGRTIAYLSRDGKLPVEDQAGIASRGEDAVRELVDDWRLGGYALGTQSPVREAFHLVLSMPAGVSEVGVLRAARDFAAVEFGDHQYVLVLHTLNTDPDPNPSAHPHVHLFVKAMSIESQRLNPRKADLQRWRQGFAQALRENGIEAVATRRNVRGVRIAPANQKVRHMVERGSTRTRSARRVPESQARSRWEQSARVLGARWSEVLIALSGSPDVADVRLAQRVAQRLGVQLSALRGRDRQVDREK